jgi:hypothetical protein
VLFRLSIALSVAAAGCQGPSSKGAPAPVAAPSIELHDAKGKVTARVTPGRPCRVTVDDIELMVGTEPLVAQVGDERWTGTDDTNGTTFKRNDATVARMAPSDRPDEAALFTPEGVAIVRATLEGGSAKLVSGAGAIIGTAAKGPKGITVGDHFTVTGTDDVLLAALLAAQDAPPEVRGLAACRRLFPPTPPTPPKASP